MYAKLNANLSIFITTNYACKLVPCLIKINLKKIIINENNTIVILLWPCKKTVLMTFYYVVT